MKVNVKNIKLIKYQNGGGPKNSPSYSWSGEGQITKPVPASSIPQAPKTNVLVDNDSIENQRARKILQLKPVPSSDTDLDANAKWLENLSADERSTLERSNYSQRLTKGLRAQNILQSEAIKKANKDRNIFHADYAGETQAIGDKMRTSLEDNFGDDYLNFPSMLGHMGSALGQVNKNIQAGNYGRAAMAVAMPMGVGALAGIGANSNLQFANNLVNPFAGVNLKSLMQNSKIKYNSFLDRNKDLNRIASKTLEKHLRNKIKQLNTDEGFKRLVEQEIEMIVNPTLRKEFGDDFFKSTGIDKAKNRIEELKKTTNLNKTIGPDNYWMIPQDNAFFQRNWNSSSAVDLSKNYFKDLVAKPKPVDPGSIGVGLQYAEHNPVYAHEINHALQNGRRTQIDNDIINHFKNTSNVKSNLTSNRRSSNKNEAALHYLLEGSNGMEPSSFLAEARQAMLDRNLIKSEYEFITPEIVNKAMNHFKNKPYINKYDRASGTRIFDIANPSENTFNFLSKQFNKLPLVLPAALTASYLNKKANGGYNVMQNGKPMYKRKDDELFDINKYQTGGFIPKYPEGGTTPAKKYDVNDPILEEGEYLDMYDVYDRRVADCKKGQCLEQANNYYNNNVASKYNLPTSYAISKSLNIPKEAFGVNSNSVDSWELPAVLASNKAKVLLNRKLEDAQSHYKKYEGDYEGEKQYWRDLKIPLGSLVSMGTSGRMKNNDSPVYNEQKGFTPTNHSARVVYYDETGLPYVYDYGKITPITQTTFGTTMPIMSVVANPGQEHITFDYVMNKKKASEITPLSLQYNLQELKDKGVSPSGDFNNFLKSLENNKTDFIKATGISNKAYDELATLTAAISLQETNGGKNFAGVSRGQPYMFDRFQKIVKDDPSEGIAQLKKSNLFNHAKNKQLLKQFGITEETYNPYNPDHAAIGTMLLHASNIPVAKTNLANNKNNNQNLKLHEALLYQYNKPNALVKGEAQGDSRYLKNVNNYLSSFVVNNQRYSPTSNFDINNYDFSNSQQLPIANTAPVVQQKPVTSVKTTPSVRTNRPVINNAPTVKRNMLPIDDRDTYQTGGQPEPEYEAEHNEVVIKSNPNDDIYMLGSGKIADESSFAGTIKGDYHGEDSDNDGQEGEAMKGGEYILSDVKTIDYEDSGKGKPSVAALARPLVKKIQELENTRDAYKHNALKYAVKDLQKIKATFDMNKQQDALCDQVLQALGQNNPALKSKLLSGLKSGELTTQDLQGMLQETQNTQPNV